MSDTSASRRRVTVLVIIGAEGAALDPPATMLKLPFADGATWKLEPPARSRSGRRRGA
jgi:hypothetical protein